jgi:hypothetical protein
MTLKHTLVVHRARWEAGWEVHLRVAFNPELLSEKDVRELAMRAGTRVGIGYGRPGSNSGVAQGFGTFTQKKVERKLKSHGEKEAPVGTRHDS